MNPDTKRQEEVAYRDRDLYPAAWIILSVVLGTLSLFALIRGGI